MTPRVVGGADWADELSKAGASGRRASAGAGTMKATAVDSDRAGPLVLWARWVRAGILRRISTSAGDVGQVLAAFGSKRGLAFPSAETISLLTGHTRTTTFSALQELVKEGVVARDGHVKRRDRNARGPVIYRFREPPPPMSLCDRDVSAAGTANPADRFKRPGVSAAETGGVSAAETQKGSLKGEKIEGAVGEGGVGETPAVLRSASPPEAAPRRTASLEAEPRKVGEAAPGGSHTSSNEGHEGRDDRLAVIEAASREKAIQESWRLEKLRTLAANPGVTPDDVRLLARKAGYTEGEISNALKEYALTHAPPDLPCSDLTCPGKTTAWAEVRPPSPLRDTEGEPTISRERDAEEHGEAHGGTLHPRESTPPDSLRSDRPPEAVIGAPSAEEPRRKPQGALASGRCQALTWARLECALRPVQGSPFCRRHLRRPVAT